MAKFGWTGTSDEGGPLKGEVEAAGLLEAAARAREGGAEVSSLERLDAQESILPLSGADAFSFFNRSLAETTRAGLPLARAVREAAGRAASGRFRRTLGRLEALLEEGRTFEAAVAELPGEFPPYYVWMVRAGTASGNLPAVLAAVARQAEGARRVKRALLSALSYPALVLLVGAAVVTGFLFSFLPIYRDIQVLYRFTPSLPLRAAYAFLESTVLQSVALGGLVAAAAAAWYWLSRRVAGERFLLALPLLGRIRRNLILTRFLGCLAALLRGRVPLPDALPVALGASGGLGLARGAERLKARALEGEGLGGILRELPGVPPAIASHIALAERTGDLARAAEDVAQTLTEQAVGESDTLYLVVFPAALLGVGILIGTLLVSVVLPYFQWIQELPH